MCSNFIKQIREDKKNKSMDQTVKSTAVVKYSAVQTPANFAQLQCNTDLNLPPSNWLSSSAESYGLQHVLSHSTGFCSFRMAHMFPDCTGEVDVISDAENVKKLLKIPYSRGPVSMMVHRIENTLLIDEFDIHKHLLRQAENDWVWLKKFFYEHVLQTLNEKEKSVILKNNSRYALQQKSLVSKFLHHSLGKPTNESSDNDKSKRSPQDNVEQNHQSAKVSTTPVVSRTQLLPEPRLEEELPDPTINHKFARNVVWTFEDLQMLLGTDMPIFGGSTHPCISLRLRDMAKPISVLTGIDYWLDNLMCNVPEVVMCYHLDGIVQRYELIKTEDLPSLPDSKFSPKLIRDVAQNILSFLKSNATKAGHTYWLFKGKDEEVVKLYDLTSLCSEGLIEKGQNPFTVPVAMLLYRVARNMKNKSSNSQAGTIRMLLKNCVSLLPKEKYPQIVTSAHYMLSDLYVPVNTDPACPELNDTDSQLSDDIGNNDDNLRNANEDNGVNSDFDYDDKESLDDNETLDDGFDLDGSEATNSVPVKSLCVSHFQNNSSGNNRHRRQYKFSEGSSSTSAPAFTGTIEERCSLALQHVVEGLQCLKYFEGDQSSCDNNGNTSAPTDVNSRHEEGTPKMAHPFQPIPMPYSPLKNNKTEIMNSSGKHLQNDRSTLHNTKNNKKHKKPSSSESSEKHSNLKCNSEEDTSPRALLCKPQAEALPTWQKPETMDNASWNAHLKTLLYEKACLVYTTLAEQYYNTERYASALHCLRYSLKCSCHMVGVYDKLVSSLLGRAGDCCFQLAQHWNQYDLEVVKSEFSCCSDFDQQIALEMERDANRISYLNECFLVPETLENIQPLLLASYHCYNRALELNPSDNLRRRLGNIHNELGSLYMNQARSAFQTSPNSLTKEKFEGLFKTAKSHLEQGIEQFQFVQDDVNLALLYSNTGRLMRLMAHYHSSNEGYPLNKTEKYYYNKALSSYQSALNTIGFRKVNPVVWDTINWELSTALYTLATLSQDYPMLSGSKDETEREVVDLLQKALKQCDIETPGPRQPIYQFRAAALHHRLGSLYHKIFRNMANDDPKKKNVLQLCQLNYEKAARLLLALEHPSEYLRVQLERVALAEFQAECSNSVHTKVKSLQSALDILIQCRPILAIMNSTSSFSSEKTDNRIFCSEENELSNEKLRTDGKEDHNENEKSKGDTDNCLENSSIEDKEREEEMIVLRFMEQRFQFLLKTLTKLSLTQTQSRLSELGPVYKEAYASLLKKSADVEDNSINSSKGIVSHLLAIIDKLKSV